MGGNDHTAPEKKNQVHCRGRGQLQGQEGPAAKPGGQKAEGRGVVEPALPKRLAAASPAAARRRTVHLPSLCRSHLLHPVACRRGYGGAILY